MLPLRMISSMATRQVLAELVATHQARTGQAVALEAVGGVDAARRVQAGEAFDVVVLAAPALQSLIDAGAVRAGSKVDLVRSGMSVAVRSGAAKPDISSEQALKQAVVAARSLGYSTGPSGTHLLKTLERWGVRSELEARLVQASPGVPVARLVAEGQVEIGFQQLSELLGAEGIEILGPLPPGVQHLTTFSAGVAVASSQIERARALIDFLASAQTHDTKRRQGMEPA